MRELQGSLAVLDGGDRDTAFEGQRSTKCLLPPQSTPAGANFAGAGKTLAALECGDVITAFPPRDRVAAFQRARARPYSSMRPGSRTRLRRLCFSAASETRGEVCQPSRNTLSYGEVGDVFVRLGSRKGEPAW